MESLNSAGHQCILKLQWDNIVCLEGLKSETDNTKCWQPDQSTISINTLWYVHSVGCHSVMKRKRPVMYTRSWQIPSIDAEVNPCRRRRLYNSTCMKFDNGLIKPWWKKIELLPLGACGVEWEGEWGHFLGDGTALNCDRPWCCLGQRSSEGQLQICALRSLEISLKKIKGTVTEHCSQWVRDMLKCPGEIHRCLQIWIWIEWKNVTGW